MSFWGIEVKPGKPFTHSFDRLRGRLRISQATLGIGSSTNKSLVQCNVGNKSPVFLCALLPDKTESLQLDLEFEEAEEVVFSVIGPRSVYLTGYYVGSSRHATLIDDSESYGEDIANTETEESNRCSDDDEYEDSFINDDDAEVLPPSPVSDGGVDEEVVNIKKPRERKGNRKRLKKKYQLVESDDDTNSRQQNIVNGSWNVVESEGEDNFPISSIYKVKTTAENMIPEAAAEQANKDIVEAGNKIVEDDDTHAKTEDNVTHVIGSKGKVDVPVIDDEPERKGDQPCNPLLLSEVGPENTAKPRKKRKELSKEGKTLDADSVRPGNALKVGKAQQDEANANNIGQDLPPSNEQDHEPTPHKGSDLPCNSLLPSDEVGSKKPKKKRKARSNEGKILEADSHINALKEDKAQQAEAEPDNMDQDMRVRNEHDQKPISNMGIGVSYDSLLPSTEVGPENGSKAKKRRKQRTVDGKLEGNIGNCCGNVLEQNQAKRDEVKADSMGKDMCERNEPDQKPADEKSFHIDSDQLADGCQSEEKKIKKKIKKKGKNLENDENVNIGVPLLSEEGKKISLMEFQDKFVDARSSQVKTLSNGLIIEELGVGKSDGKIAASGRKVKIFYTAKLKENGQIIDSNIGKAPYRFRLGDEDVIEGWNVGLDGMRVGDKRRLVIPPSMGYGSQGTGENIPPNSWLVYDVELISVR